MSARDDILTVHQHLTNELAELLVDRGMSQQAAVQARATMFADQFSAGNNITTVREMAANAAATFDGDIANLTGKIDALRVRLHHLDQRLAGE